MFVSTCICVKWLFVKCVFWGEASGGLHFRQRKKKKTSKQIDLMAAPAAFPLDRSLPAWSESRAQKENRAVGKEPGQRSGQGPLELPMS